MAAGHVRGRPGLVDAQQATRIEFELSVGPSPALHQAVGLVLLGRMPGLSHVIP